MVWPLLIPTQNSSMNRLKTSKTRYNHVNVHYKAKHVLGWLFVFIIYFNVQSLGWKLATAKTWVGLTSVLKVKKWKFNTTLVCTFRLSQCCMFFVEKFPNFRFWLTRISFVGLEHRITARQLAMQKGKGAMELSKSTCNSSSMSFAEVHVEYFKLFPQFFWKITVEQWRTFLQERSSWAQESKSVRVSR